MKISKVKSNPNNPRFIKDENFIKLCKSISDFPKMLELRPIIIDENFVVQGGNMRLRALMEIGYKELEPEWIKQVFDLSEDQKKEFIIKDNASFGSWDWDLLANDWNESNLKEWGILLPSEIDFDNININEGSQKKDNTKMMLCPNCNTNINI